MPAVEDDELPPPPRGGATRAWYLQLRSDLDVTLRQAVKEMHDAIVKRIDDDARRRERADDARDAFQRETDDQIRALQRTVPDNLQEQLQELRATAEQAKTMARTLAGVFAALVTLAGLVATLHQIFKGG